MAHKPADMLSRRDAVYARPEPDFSRCGIINAGYIHRVRLNGTPQRLDLNWLQPMQKALIKEKRPNRVSGRFEHYLSGQTRRSKRVARPIGRASHRTHRCGSVSHPLSASRRSCPTARSMPARPKAAERLPNPESARPRYAGHAGRRLTVERRMPPNRARNFSASVGSAKQNT